MRIRNNRVRNKRSVEAAERFVPDTVDVVFVDGVVLILEVEMHMGMLGSANDMQQKMQQTNGLVVQKINVVEQVELKVEMNLEMRKTLEEKHNLLNF